MYRVEFETKIENGLVHIPHKYKDLRKSTTARFIVVHDYNSDNEKSNTEQKRMSAISIDTSNFTFNRDEANER